VEHKTNHYTIIAIIFILAALVLPADAARINYPKFQVVDANGDPVTGGKLYTYEKGTTTDKATYSDYDLQTAHANPIVLDSLGEKEIHGSGYYKLVLKDSDDTEIWTIDNFLAGEEVNWVSIADYGNSLNTAVSEIGATPTTLLIDTQITVSQNVTVPATLHLWVLNVNNAALQPDNGITITYNCPITAGSYQIFGGSGTHTITGIVGPINNKWSSGGAETIRFPGLLLDEIAAPTVAANQGGIYTKAADSQTELYFRGESDDDEVQLTDGPKPPLPRSYLAGMTLSPDTDTAHDINITAGEARDSGNAVNLILATETTKQIDAIWAAGDDAGGLFSGTVAIDTWYHLFIIKKDSDGSFDAGFDTSVTAANIPTGYTDYRRIGSVLTDGSANIIGFKQIGDEFFWDDPPMDATDLDVDAAQEAVILTVPPGVNVKAFFNLTNETTGQSLYIPLHQGVNNEAPSQQAAAPLATYNQSNNANSTYTVWAWTDTSKQINIRASAANAVVNIATLGWLDRRGKDN
jgi:hypothetical protein